MLCQVMRCAGREIPEGGSGKEKRPVRRSFLWWCILLAVATAAMFAMGLVGRREPLSCDRIRTRPGRNGTAWATN